MVTTLSIWIPSHSDYNNSLPTLQNAQTISTLPGVEVVIVDNSKDLKKHQKWEALQTYKFKYIHSPYQKLGENLEFAVSQINGEWSAFLSDDDHLFNLQHFESSEFNCDKDIVGMRPSVALYNNKVGIYRSSNFSIDSETSTGRINQYLENHHGSNSTLFSFFKTKIIKDIFLNTLTHHPTQGGYYDWAITLALAAEGKILNAPNLLFVYNNKNWYSKEVIEASTRKVFTDAGMKPDNSEILNVHLALDSFTLISRKSSSVSIEEKIEASQFAFNIFLTQFAHQIADSLTACSSQSDLYTERVALSLNLIADAGTLSERIYASLEIINLWNPDLKDKYIEYMKKVIDERILCGLFSLHREDSRACA